MQLKLELRRKIELKNELKLNEKGLWTAKDVSKYMNIGLALAYELLKSEGFPTIKIRTRMYTNKTLLDEWIKDKANKGE